MDFGIISSRYAKALLRFATQRGEAPAVKQEVERVSQAFTATPAFASAMLNPLLTASQKAALILAASQTGSGAKPTGSLARFADLVATKGRADLFPLICRRFLTLYGEREGIVDVRITSAAPLSAANREKLQKLVAQHLASHTDGTEKPTLQFHTQEDASLGAGFVLEYGTYRLDAALHTRIARIKRRLSGE